MPSPCPRAALVGLPAVLTEPVIRVAYLDDAAAMRLDMLAPVIRPGFARVKNGGRSVSGDHGEKAKQGMEGWLHLADETQ